MQFLSKPDSFCFTSGLDTIIIRPGTSTPVTFSIKMGNVTVLPQETYYRDASGIVYINDIGQVIDAWLRQDIAPAYLLNQQITVAEFSFVYNGTTIHQHTIMRCDVDFDVTAAVFCKTRFLNLMFATKKTSLERKEILAYYDLTAGTKATISATFLQSGKLVTDTIYKDPISSDQCAVKYLDVSPVHFAKANATLQHYTVKVGDRSQEFVLDHISSLQQTHFVYRNAFGCEDTFTCVGEATSEGKYERYYATYSGGYKNYKRKNLREFSVNTGHLSQAAAYCLDDVFASEEIWLYDQQGLIKEIVILDQSVKRSSAFDELPNFEFSYRLTQTNQRVKTALGARIFDASFDRSFE